MGIPISSYVHEEDGRSVVIKWLRPSNILRYLLSWYPSLLLGGFEPGVEAEAMLSTFWKQYRLNHPSHAVFGQNFASHRCIPFNLHGDGARTQKTTVGSGFTGSSSGTRQRQLQTPLGAANQCGNPLVQCLNHRYHTYLSRFLIFAFPSLLEAMTWPA